MCQHYDNIFTALAAVEINFKLQVNMYISLTNKCHTVKFSLFRWTFTCDSVWVFAFAAEIETTLNAFWSGILYLINKL